MATHSVCANSGCVREQHANHLENVLKEHHEISQDWEGKKNSGIDLQCNYAAKHHDITCRLSIKNYIADLLLKLGHHMPKKTQLSPHKCKTVNYGIIIQMDQEMKKIPKKIRIK